MVKIKNKDDFKRIYLIDDDNRKNDLPKLKKKRLRPKRFLRRIGLILLIIILFTSFMVSGIKVLFWYRDSKKTEQTIQNIENITEVKEVQDTEKTVVYNPPKKDKTNIYWDHVKMNLLDVDFNNLLNINSDTVGWIEVNGTNINYPFVQTNNNEYYLKKDFNKKYNSAGWVFLDYRNNLENLNRNTIIYAHGRIDGTMFGSLKNIIKSNWYDDKNNHILKIATKYNSSLWQVFSVYHIPTTSDYLDIEFETDTDYIEFLKKLQTRSYYQFEVDLNENDKIVTLSTCYGDNERVVLHAKLIKMEEKDGSN